MRFLVSCLPAFLSFVPWEARPYLMRALGATTSCLTKMFRIAKHHSRQQVGLHGASPGGQAEAMGSDRLPLEWGAACSLKSFSMTLVPHCGQAASSPERTSTSNSQAHSPQRNSNSGIRHALPG
jgi:hypothetical protein